MFKKLLKNKKIVSLIMAFSIVMAMGVCFASEGSTDTGITSFMSTLTTGLSATNIWGAIAPIGGLILIVTLIAVARRVLNKNLNSVKTGKSGKV